LMMPLCVHLAAEDEYKPAHLHPSPRPLIFGNSYSEKYLNYKKYLFEAHTLIQSKQRDNLEQALVLLNKLAEAPLPDLDLATIHLNSALVYKALGQQDQLFSYLNKAIAIESKYSKYRALKMKADYLSQLGQQKEACAIYQNLLRRHDLTLEDLAAISQKNKSLR
jgi:tetratricopeptide (TPR) repeat protein